MVFAMMIIDEFLKAVIMFTFKMLSLSVTFRRVSEAGKYGYKNPIRSTFQKISMGLRIEKQPW